MNTLKIDDKWSVEYDPMNNDRPVSLLRHGERTPYSDKTINNWDNPTVAMFYALLESRNEAAAQKAIKLNLSEDSPHYVPENPSIRITTPNDFPHIARTLVEYDDFTEAFLTALADRIHAGARSPQQKEN